MLSIRLTASYSIEYSKPLKPLKFFNAKTTVSLTHREIDVFVLFVTKYLTSN